MNDHTVGYVGAAGRCKVFTTFHFHHANAATTGFVFNIQVIQLHVAKGRYMYAGTGSRFQNGNPFLNDYRFVIYG
jgi:hypothetical protein